MKFSTTVAELRDSLSVARPVIPANPSLLAYSGVHLEVADGVLHTTGSDGETTLSARTPVNEVDPGRVLVSPKPLAGFLSGLPASTRLSVSVEAGDLVIEPESMEAYRFRPLAATYPAAPTPAGEAVSTDFSRLALALSVIKSAVPKDTSAVQLVSTDSGLSLNATDTYRLAHVELPEAAFGAFTGVVPLAVLERAAKANTDTVRIDTKARMISFASPEVTVTARLLAIPFPAVEAVLASVPPDKVRFAPSDLTGALGRITSIADQSAVAVSIEEASMRLSASSAEVGQGAETVALSEAAPVPFEVLVRGSFLQDACAAVGSDHAQLHYSGPLQPLFLRASEPFDVVHVVMPVRS